MSRPIRTLSDVDLAEVARAFAVFANRYKLADPKLILDDGRTEIKVDNASQAFRHPQTCAEWAAFRATDLSMRSDGTTIIKQH